MKPRLSSCAQMFEERGDKWLTEKEAIREFKRNPAAENPGYDLGFGRTPLQRPDTGFPAPATRTAEQDATLFHRRKMTNILANMNKRITTHVHTMPENKSITNTPIKAAPAKTQAGYSLYIEALDGTETESEKKTEIAAKTSFRRAVAAQNRRVELWSYATGEIVMAWENRRKK